MGHRRGQVLATFIAVAYVDRFGRKPLLLTGLVGMATSLTVVGFCFLRPEDHPKGSGESMAGIFTLVGLVVFIASFAFSLGPVVWTMINEIFPSRIRGRGVPETKGRRSRNSSRPCANGCSRLPR